MNSAFAHDQIYPHLHPHAALSAPADLLLSLLWWGGIAFAIFLLTRLTRYIAFRRRR